MRIAVSHDDRARENVGKLCWLQTSWTAMTSGYDGLLPKLPDGQ